MMADSLVLAVDARGSDGAAEEVFGDAVAVEHLRFGMPDRIRERVDDLGLAIG